MLGWLAAENSREPTETCSPSTAHMPSQSGPTLRSSPDRRSSPPERRLFANGRGLFTQHRASSLGTNELRQQHRLGNGAGRGRSQRRSRKGFNAGHNSGSHIGRGRSHRRSRRGFNAGHHSGKPHRREAAANAALERGFNVGQSVTKHSSCAVTIMPSIALGPRPLRIIPSGRSTNDQGPYTRRRTSSLGTKNEVARSRRGEKGHAKA